MKSNETAADWRKAPPWDVAYLRSRSEARPLGDIVADAIVGAIAQGMFEPGDRIVEEILARRLKVSRVPIREAIRILQGQGLLVVTPNKGARVASFDDRVVREVNEARIAIESIAVAHALRAFRRNPRLFEPLEDIIAQMEAAARRSDWDALRRCDLAFHQAICTASGNDIVGKLWQALSRYIVVIFGREIARERNFEIVISQHRKLLGLLAKGGRGIRKELEAHILRLSANGRTRAAGRGK